MKKLISGAFVAFSAAVTAATPTLKEADLALLSKVNQAQYQALIYTASECGFEPSLSVSVTLLKSPGFTPIVDALARPTGPLPLLDEKACFTLLGN